MLCFYVTLSISISDVAKWMEVIFLYLKCVVYPVMLMLHLVKAIVQEKSFSQ